MKIFAIYLKLNLTNKPKWFEGFRLKYDEDFDLHVTLIQPRYVNESKIDELKSKITVFLDRNMFTPQDKTINFNDLAYSQEQDGSYTFMLLAEKAPKLFELQASLMGLLKNLRNTLIRTV